MKHNKAKEWICQDDGVSSLLLASMKVDLTTKSKFGLHHCGRERGDKRIYRSVLNDSINYQYRDSVGFWKAEVSSP